MRVSAVTLRSPPPDPALMVELQCDAKLAVPTGLEFQDWGQCAISLARPPRDAGPLGLALRLVDLEEGAALNQQFRGREGATNVLAFPAALPPGLPDEERRPLGDLVICAPLVAREAQARRVEERAHWAHLFVHGVLHLLGYDHQDDQQASLMERKESAILFDLGFRNPYAAER